MSIFQEDVPRNQGSGEKPPMSTAAGNVLIEGVPQSLFGSFLVTQKGTRPAGRNPPHLQKKKKSPGIPGLFS